jgi:Holliday junction DNA helicase RuvA
VALCHLQATPPKFTGPTGETMIAGVKGTIESIGSNWVIVDVGGVSYQVFLPTSTLSKLGVVGQPVKLHTHLHVREDNMTLFGFGSARELALFQTLLSVSGIGPKLGLAMLSSMDVEQLTMVIASGDADMLSSHSGNREKNASRIVLELKEKVSTEWMVTQDLEAVQEQRSASSLSLGYSISEATRAVAAFPDSRCRWKIKSNSSPSSILGKVEQ